MVPLIIKKDKIEGVNFEGKAQIAITYNYKQYVL